MKVCFILEGSYPYVRGGVSTWVDGVIRAMPEHEFILWTITDTEEVQGNYKYEIPDNVVEIHENSLNSSFNLRIQKNPNLKLTSTEKIAVSQLLRHGNPEWQILLESFHEQVNKPVEFFISEEFLTILKEFSKDELPFAGFKDLFWTIRSMYLPLFYLIGQPMPKADLYHSPSTGYAGVLGALASMKYDKPYVLTEHGIYTREREEEILRSDWVISYFKDLWISMFYMFARLAYQQAHCVTSLYQHASLIQQELGCPSSKCEIVANGLNIDAFSNIPLKEEDDWVDIAAIVRFAHIKDIKTMIYTFSRLKQEYEQVRLHILGGVDDEEYYQECLDLINFLGVKDVIIAGTVNIISYLEKIDFTLLTSISEGQPYAVLESMAAGRPVVATDVGNCRELIEGADGDFLGPAGICVPPMHQSELLRALGEMCHNVKARKNMNGVGKKRIKQYFEHGNMIKKYLAVYEKAVEKWQESALN